MSDAQDLSINWGPQPDTGDPEIHIYTDGDIRINAAAGREYFSDAKQTDVGADADAGLLVFDPAGDRSPLKIRREGNEVGGEVAGASRTKQLLDLNRLDECLYVPLEERTDGLLVADVQAALADVNEEPTMSQAAPESSGSYATPDKSNVANDDAPLPGSGDAVLTEYHSSEPLVEEYLIHALSHGFREVTSSEIAVMIDGVSGQQVGGALRTLKNSDESPLCVRTTDQEAANGATVWHVEPSVELAAKLESDLDVDLESVLGEDVNTVQELAEALDVDEGEARRRAMDSGVYSDLQDNVKRPGVRD